MLVFVIQGRRQHKIMEGEQIIGEITFVDLSAAKSIRQQQGFTRRVLKFLRARII